MAGGFRRILLSGAAFALFYQAVAALIVLNQSEAAVTFWYPPAGIGMLGVLLFGPLAAGLVFLCDFVVMRFQFGLDPMVGTIVAAATTLECLAFCILNRCMRPRLPVRDLRVFLKIFASIVCASGAGALSGSLLLLSYRGAGTLPFALEFSNWWVSDFSGAIAVVSVGLFGLRAPSSGTRALHAADDAFPGGWPRMAATGLTWSNAPAFAGLLATISVLVYLAFYDLRLLPGLAQAAASGDRINFGFGFLLTIPIVWIAHQYRASLVALTMLYVSALVAVALVAGASNELALNAVSQFGIFNVQMMLAAVTLLGVSISIVAHGERLARGAEQRALAVAEQLHQERAVALEEGEELAKRLHETIETIKDAFYILDDEWRFIYANREVGVAGGRPGMDFLGRCIWDEFPAILGTSIERNFRKSARTRQPITFDAGYAPEQKWFSIRTYPTAEGMAVYAQDVTEQMRQRQQLQLMQTAVEHMTDMVQISTAGNGDLGDQRVIYVNEAFVRTTGYSREEILGKSPFMIFGEYPSQAELERAREALTAEKRLQAEYVGTTRDGAKFLREVSVIPIHDTDGVCTHYVSVSRDVTERRRIEEHMRQSQKLEAIGKLTGGVAHDFNNMLAVIMGNAEMLAGTLAPESPATGHVQAIQKAAGSGVEMIRHLLAFSRRQALAPKVVDVGQHVKEMTDMLKQSLGGTVDLKVIAGADAGCALIDPGQLGSAVLNLVLNARDAMPGGGTVTVETARVEEPEREASEVPPGSYVTVSVRDTGTGIAPAALERVFEPFFTTKEAGAGTGLGLSMVYGFVMQSGGHVDIETRPGAGTCVRLAFPQSQAPAVAPSAPRSLERNPRGDERIFVVEDNDMVRSTVTAQLLALGYTVVEAATGVDALRVLAEDRNFDLLFTDVAMPGGVNGPQLASKARQMMPELPVLFTSGYADSALLSNSDWATNALLLNKPHRFADLARSVRDALDAA